MKKCPDTEHRYFPATFETMQVGLRVIQKATSLVCARCLDIKYITDVELPKEQAQQVKQEVKEEPEGQGNENGKN